MPMSTTASRRKNQPQQPHRDLKIERLLGLARDEGHGLPLGPPDDEGSQYGEQHQTAEGEKNQRRRAHGPQQAAEVSRHRPIALFCAQFDIHAWNPTYNARIPSRGRYGGEVVKFKPLLDRWKKEAAPALTVEHYSIRLPLDDASRLHALAELFPGRKIEDIVTDLLHAALDEIARPCPMSGI